MSQGKYALIWAAHHCVGTSLVTMEGTGCLATTIPASLLEEKKKNILSVI